MQCRMPGAGRCPDCGSAELVEDSHYSQSQLVCSDCGCVVTEGVLTTTFSEESNLRGTVLGEGLARRSGGPQVPLLTPAFFVPHSLNCGRRERGQGLPLACLLARHVAYAEALINVE